MAFFPDCKKADLPYVCATCTESHSHYTAADYCGAGADVDAYINKLIDEGNKVGQSWTCTKH